MKIFNKITLLFIAVLFTCSLYGQMKVKGIVISAEDNLPVIGGSVLVKGTTTGTTTDFDGSYEVTVPDGNSVLIFSYTGLQTQEVEVNNRSQIDLTLSLDAKLLDEVVVIGYGSQKKSQISGAVGVISSEELLEGSNLRVEQALQGKATGVLVSKNSGSPGAALLVRVRGISTINDASPLFIVDGIRVEGLDYLNNNDIESISILKDAASAAIYGASAGNGVVLITTKNGKKNQRGRISYDGYVGMQSVAKKLNLLNAEEYAIIQNESYVAAGQKPLPEFENPQALGEGTDWQDAVFGSAPIASHQLTISGGGEKSAYLISGNYFTQDGILGSDIGEDKSNFDRYTFRFNGNHEVKKWLDVGNTLSFTTFTRNALPENSQYNSPTIRALNIDPTTPVYKEDGTFAYSKYADTDIANPVNAIDKSYDTWTSNRIVGSAFVNIKPMKGLVINSNYSVDATFASQDIFNPAYDLSVDTTLSDAPAAEKVLVNSVIDNRYEWKNWQWENTATYGFSLSDIHEFTIIAGTSARFNRSNFAGASGTSLPSNDIKFAFIDNTIDLENRKATSWSSESSGFSIFGRIGYSLLEKYHIQASLRNDGSSKFGPNNRYGRFPAVSAGWTVSKEDFFNMKGVENLKIRASWGVNGNDRIRDFQFLSVINAGQNYVFGPNEAITNGSTPIQASNPDVKWEESRQTNIGVDLDLFNNKLGFIVDYFNKNTEDMLYAAPIPFHVGAEAPIQNIADMTNKGWEFAVNYRNRDNKLKYALSANLTTIQTEITSLGNGGEPIFTGTIQSANASAIKTDIGLPLAAFWGYQMDGLFQNQAEVEAHAFQSEETAPGDIRFVDINNDGVIDNEDQTLLGSALPEFTFGVNGSVEYLGFDLSAFLYGSQGNEIYNNTVRYDFNYVNRPNSVLNRWTGEGTSDSEPRVNLKDPNQNARISSRFVEDGSYLRLKNVELGYTVPSNILEKIKFTKLRAYVSAQNLLTWTKYSGYDPEIGQVNTENGLELGIDYGFYPSSRTVLFGLQAEF